MQGAKYSEKILVVMLFVLVVFLGGCVSTSLSEFTTHGGNKFKTYTVEKNKIDYIFTIAGRKYTAKTYCYGISIGDRVVFLEGDPESACNSAKFKNLNTGTICYCWCDQGKQQK